MEQMMNNNIPNELCEIFLNTFGESSQISMLMGECGELTAALNRYHTQLRGNNKDVITEIADVLNLIEHWVYIEAKRLAKEHSVAECGVEDDWSLYVSYYRGKITNNINASCISKANNIMSKIKENGGGNYVVDLSLG